MEKVRNQLAAVGKVVSNHFPGFVLLHIWLTAGLIFTGSDWLEPLAASWFWAPVLATLIAGDAWTMYELGFPERFAEWYRRNHGIIWFINWVINFTVIPIIFWSFFHRIDVQYLHPIREATGKGFGLGGQTGLVLTVNGFLSLPLIYWELRRIKEALDGRAAKRARRRGW